MILKELFEDDDVRTSGATHSGAAVELGNRDVSAVVFDNRKIQPGCVFVAIRGTQTDSHVFLADAAAKGAIALVVEDTSNVPASFQGYVRQVKSSRAELARLAALWSRRASRELFTVGVTGTNGKTTTTHMIEAVLNFGGLPTGVIGTIDHHLGSRVWSTERTTPDPVVFQTRLREFVDHGAKAVALEVTSHALDQARVDAVEYDVGIFTNLTRDHLDYHGTTEAYFEAKLRFFTELLKNSSKNEVRAILNVDDEWVQKAADRLEKFEKPKVWTFGEKGHARKGVAARRAPDFEFEVEDQDFDGVRVKLKTLAGEFALNLAMAGLHNVQNAVCAFATGLAAKLSPDVVKRAVESIRGVNGRLESVPNDRGLHIFVDYAHTDDALIAILRLLQEIRTQAARRGKPGGQAKILTVFGCGGDRDRGKRPMMMRAALNGSDHVIVTSDNPRTEDPDRIIDDAMAAITSADEKNKVDRLTDRRAAIQKALRSARVGDVVLIAGKGHEATQTIGTTKYPFSDAKVVQELLKEIE